MMDYWLVKGIVDWFRNEQIAAKSNHPGFIIKDLMKF